MADNYNFKPPTVSASGGGGSMQRQMATAAVQQQTLLRCPRCDSSNTKFCYYNNYSLSQPRHFCKSCKRYWTRGGTLRNVPVGGSCRKNKRGVKRPAPAAATGAVASAGSRSASGGNKPSPLFSYGNHPKVDLGYASLGFPSVIRGNVDGLVVPSANSVIPRYGASSDFPTTMSLNGIPTVASSLLASTIFQDQRKFMSMGGLGFKEDRGIRNNLKSLNPLENVQLKFDEGRHIDDINWSMPFQTQIHGIDSSDLTKSWCWNAIANDTVASWHHEPGSNVGSSVPSLI